MDTFTINELLVTAWKSIEPRLIVLIVLTLFDFVFGVALAVIAKEFRWNYLTNYLLSDILPILAWMAASVISAFPATILPQGALPIVGDVIYGTVFLRIGYSVVHHFTKMGVIEDREEKAAG